MKTIKILLVEGDDDYRAFIKDLLEGSNLKFEIEESTSSKSALVKMETHHYDCILSDYLIPGLSGFNLMEKARDLGITAPFLIMTAWGDGNLEKELIKRGVGGYISKDNLRFEDLLNKLIDIIPVNSSKEEKIVKIKAGETKNLISSLP